MKHAFLVFFGGGLGSVARYFLGKWLNNLHTLIPYGTFLANVLGSLLIGLILGYLSKASHISQNQTLLFATGFCGGFTTFSAFMYENHFFLKNGDYFSFLIYTIGSILLGLIAVFVGLYMARLL